MSNKKIKKYGLQILLIIISFFMIAILPAIMGGGEGFTDLLPINKIGLQVAFMFWMYVLGAIVGVLMGYVLTPLFLIVHKKVIGRKMIYGIQERPEPEKFRGTFKAFFPALMGLNFALMYVFNDTVQELLRIPSDLDFVVIIASMFLILMLTFGIAMILFSPVWFLLDAGIVYTNKEKVRNTTKPIEMKSVGGFYMGFLKGYAGISVIFAFYAFVVDLLNRIPVEDFHWSQPFLLFFLPILLCFWSLPAVLLFELTREHRRKFVMKWVDKVDIDRNLNIEITQKKNL